MAVGCWAAGIAGKPSFGCSGNMCMLSTCESAARVGAEIGAARTWRLGRSIRVTACDFMMIMWYEKALPRGKCCWMAGRQQSQTFGGTVDKGHMTSRAHDPAGVSYRRVFFESSTSWGQSIAILPTCRSLLLLSARRKRASHAVVKSEY